jgi:hypothetical protein
MPWIIGVCGIWFRCHCSWFKDNAKSYHSSRPSTEVVFIRHGPFKIFNMHRRQWQVWLHAKKLCYWCQATHIN